jgi:O-antigen/teichoic acid export membrane protein
MNTKTIISFALGPISSAILGFITLPIVTWLYSPEDMGRISMLLVVASFSILFFSLGLDQSYVREYNEYGNKPRLFKMAILPGLILLLLTGSFFLLEPALLSKLLFTIENSTYSQIIVLFTVLSLLSRFLSLILRMEQRGLAFSMSQVLPKIIFLAGIGVIYFWELSSDFYYLLLAHLLSIASVTLIFLFSTRNTWLKGLRYKIDWPFEKKMLRFGRPLILGGVAYWGLTAADKLFIQHYASYEQLGIYSVAISFAGAATIIQSIFSTIWVPIVYKWVADGKDLTKVNTVREYLLLIVIFVFIMAGLFSWVVGYLIPTEYVRVPYMLVVCLAAPLFFTLSETTVVGLGVTRNSKLSMFASVLAFIFNVIGNYILVPNYGAEGAAISTAISFWLFFVLRTEFAIYVWQPIKRLKLYSMTLSALFLSIGFMMFGESNVVLFNSLWGIFLLVLLMSNKKLIKVVLVYIFILFNRKFRNEID